MWQTNKEKGAVLYLTFWMMSLLMGIAFGVSGILVTQLGLLRGVGHSTLAFAATDAGAEHANFLDTVLDACLAVEDEEERQTCLSDEGLPPESCDIDGGNIPLRVQCLKDAREQLFSAQDPIELANLSAYTFVIEASGEGGCEAENNYCVKSTGSFGEARRAVRLLR